MNVEVQPEWRSIHDQDKSWRSKLIGDLSEVYVMPRYLQLFKFYFQQSPQPLSFLELGSGNGDMAELIVKSKLPFIKQYTVSEQFEAGVAGLKKRGLQALQVNAEQIPFPEKEFDAVVSFDVMHHVNAPRQMALEMMRAARGRLFLTESNGLSLGRKLMELTPAHRRAGEKSYTPAQYRSFFNHPGYRLTRFEINPFIFPLKIGNRFLKQEVAFNQWIERAWFLRWQCSNVYIYVEYERTSS